jgi:NAD(P)-dependent dehydrogenase (short-subunit alcohol dehydrogenase family)
MVITGSSSGIGLATAQMAAERGAKLVLAARSRFALAEIAARLRDAGTEVIAVECDVSTREQVDALVAAASRHFGRIDRTDEADARRLFDINF